MKEIELGVYTFGESMVDPLTNTKIDPAQRVRDLLEEMELADQVGLDVFGLGEHHRPDYVVSSPAVVLAAGAARTRRIRLTSAVSVISADDPVRVYQDFALLDLISGGRAEIMAGRGSFIEAFPLFGYDLDDYDELFTEKLDLLLAIRANERVTWSGNLRPPIHNLGVYPRPLQERLPVWIAVGGSAESAARAGQLGLPMALAIIGGMPERFAPFVQIYRDAARRSDHDSASTALSINSMGYIADTSQRAADEFYPSYAATMSQLGRERGWPPMTRSHFETLRQPRGSLFLGSPQEVIDKVLFEHELFKFDRLLLQFSVGALPHAMLMHSIELLGTKVAPAVRKVAVAK